jgi:hypothetical protein
LNFKKSAIIFLIFIAWGNIYGDSVDNEPDNEYKQGVLIFKNGNAVAGQWRKYNGDYFLRDEKQGVIIKALDITDIVSEDYYKKIKGASPMQSMTDSLLYFHASSEYQWRGFTAKTSNEDLYFRIGKITLLTLSGLTYYNALQSNVAVGNSYEGFNDPQKKHFVQSYNYYLAASSLTLGFFAFSTLRAYMRFGKNSNGDTIGIPESRLKDSIGLKSEDNKRQLVIGFIYQF